jgi:hypothetical protein
MSHEVGGESESESESERMLEVSVPFSVFLI